MQGNYLDLYKQVIMREKHTYTASEAVIVYIVIEFVLR